MKKKIVKVHKNKREATIKQYETFFYVLQEEKDKNDCVILTFSRDLSSHKNKDEILRLEDEFNSLKVPSLQPLIVLASIAFVLLSALLICILIFKDTAYKDIFIYSLGIPSIIVVVIMSGFYYFRMSRLNRHIALGDKAENSILKRLEEIKNENE